MKRVFLCVAMMALVVCGMAQETKKVAVTETVEKEQALALSAKNTYCNALTKSVNAVAGYDAQYTYLGYYSWGEAFERTGEMTGEMMKEIVERTPVDYILVPEAEAYDERNMLVTAKLYNLETGQVEAVEPWRITIFDPGTVKKLCEHIVGNLLTARDRDEKRLAHLKTLKASVEERKDGGVTVWVGRESFDMVKVEAGSFVMGCAKKTDEDCTLDEQPQHDVTLTEDYYMGVFEVTQELYEVVMGVNPSSTVNRGIEEHNLPVENVSWEDAQEFCERLSILTGRRFSLPTEAEWEFAARGGNKTKHFKHCGSDELDEVAWVGSKSYQRPVGSLKPNELGIYDMQGNVQEWCQDWFAKYSDESQTNPTGPTYGTRRVARGGCYDCMYYHIASRIPYDEDYRGLKTGFRIVLH